MIVKKSFDFVLGKVNEAFYLTNGATVYKLNKTGADIFYLANGKRSIDEISLMIANKYSAPIHVVKQDVINTVKYSISLGILIKKS